MTFDPTQNRIRTDELEAAARYDQELVEYQAYQVLTAAIADAGYGQTAALKLRAIRATLDAAEAHTSGVKPMNLSNMLKHAFIAGRISAGASSSFHGHAWAEYDPTESAAYARILSALHPASPLGAVRLYLDLDGVMADFDAHYPAEFGQDHKSMADDDMWAKITAHPSYFEDMPLCPGAADFFAEIRHLKPIILTACPRTNYAHVAGQKRRWVHKHLGKELTVLPVMGGHNKHLFMHAPGDILIDDYDKNCAPWRKSGGFAILHTSFDATRAALAAILTRKGDEL